MEKFFRRLYHNSFFQGGMMLTITNLIVGFLNYLFNSLSGKLLGPAKYSEISVLFAYLVILGVPASVIQAEIIRRLGNAGNKRIELIKSWQLWFFSFFDKWKYLIIFYVFFFILIIPSLTNLTLLYSLTLMVLLLMTFFSIFYISALLGLHLFFLYSLTLILSTIAKLLGPLLVYIGIDGSATIAIFIVISSVTLVLVGKIGLDRLLRKVKAKDFLKKRIVSILLNKQIIVMTLSIVSIMLINNLDVIFIKKYYSAREAGIYGAWNLFSKIIFYLLSPILSITYIFFTTKETEKKHLLIFIISCVLLIIASIILYLLYLSVGGFLVALIFNEKYAYIVSILPQAAIFGILFVTINFFNGFFLAKKSLVALTTLIFIPFYALSLFFFGKRIEQVVNINLIFSALVAFTYLFLFLIKLNSYSKSSQRPFAG